MKKCEFPHKYGKKCRFCTFYMYIQYSTTKKDGFSHLQVLSEREEGRKRKEKRERNIQQSTITSYIKLKKVSTK